MKLRWWIIGGMAILTGGIFVLKHFVENKDKALDHINDDNEKIFSEVTSGIPESGFEEIDFLT
jgi:hypothetical protein